MLYQGVNVVLNVTELACMLTLATVFLYNRINILKQYEKLIDRLDRILTRISEPEQRPRGKTSKKQDN